MRSIPGKMQQSGLRQCLWMGRGNKITVILVYLIKSMLEISKKIMYDIIHIG